MPLNQVLLEGTLLDDPREAQGAKHVHFRLLCETSLEGRAIFPVEMWLGHEDALQSRKGDRVLVVGYLRKTRASVKIRAVRLRRLLVLEPPSVPLQEPPDPIPGVEEIPF
ncbi:MAG: hypothetical protein HY721_04530 [Planctomycetes bacterium]|nr:hypothetical protein [Planctomycetota bacterium]